MSFKCDKCGANIYWGKQDGKVVPRNSDDREVHFFSCRRRYIDSQRPGAEPYSMDTPDGHEEGIITDKGELIRMSIAFKGRIVGANFVDTKHDGLPWED